MKTHRNGFLPGFISALLLVGLIGTAAATVGKRTLEVDYSDIKITLDGNMVIPLDANKNYVEPFSIGGTVYLPIRATANAVNLDVDWDGKNSTVLLKTKPVKTAMDPFYENTTIPKFDFVIGLKAFEYKFDNVNDQGITAYSYNPALSENGDYDTLVKLYADMLAKIGYKQTFVDSTGLAHEYKNSQTKVSVTVNLISLDDGSKFISVSIAPAKTSTSSSATSSSSSSSSDEPAPPPSPSPDPTPVFDFTVPHLTAQGTRPGLCTYCQTELRRFMTFDDGRAIYKCRDPQCGKYEIPIYYTP